MPKCLRERHPKEINYASQTFQIQNKLHNKNIQKLPN